MKVLFLDIDGVVLPFNVNGKTRDDFDKKSVKVLNRIIEKTDCEIVVSSDWRNHCTLKQLENIFEYNGVIKKPIDITPNSIKYDMEGLDVGRVDEIKMWLDDNKEKHNIEEYCAVDDLDLSELGPEHFVQCVRPYNEGIKQTSIEDKIIKRLTKIEEIV